MLFYSDLMFELRRIQHGERPVTGQNHRDNIANFMAKHSQEPAGATGKENVPANVDAVEEHRPEAVVVEVIIIIIIIIIMIKNNNEEL